MRKTKKKLLAMLLSAAMLTGSVLAPGQADTASAAAKIKTNKTKVTVTVGKTVKVKVKNTGSRKLKVKVSNKKTVTVKVVKKQIKITGKKAGKAKVTLTAAGMKKCVIAVTVKSKSNTVAASPASDVKNSAAPGASTAPGASEEPTATPVPAKKVVYDGTNWDDILKSDEPLDIEVAEGVESLENKLQSNDKIRSIKLPETIKTIGENEFEYCENLESVTLPKGLEEIGAYAFQDCKNLKEIYIPANVTEIKIGALRGCENLEKITVDPENKVYDSRNNCNAIIQKKGNVLIAGCANTVIPEDVIGIGNQAFDGAVHLEELVLPEGLQYIGSEDASGDSRGVFWRTGLKEIVIPKTVTYIVEGAFRYCSALKTIAVKEGNLIYDSRNNCNAVIRTNDNKVIVICLNTTIPETVTSIGNYAYSEEIGEAAKYISIPSQITEIDENAFDVWKNTTTTWTEHGFSTHYSLSDKITFSWNGNTYSSKESFLTAFKEAHAQPSGTPSAQPTAPTSSNVPSGSSSPAPTRDPLASGTPGATENPKYCLTLREGASFRNCIPQGATSVVFTDAVLPATATAITVAEDNTVNGVVGWRAGRIFYVSSQGHGKIKANADMSYMFSDVIADEDDDYGTLSTLKLQSIDFTNLDTSGAKNMSHMFEGCSKLSSVDLSSFDTSNVTDMSAMFYSCSALTELDLSSFDTSKVTKVYAGWDKDYEVDWDSDIRISYKGMFAQCQNLKKLTFNKDKWDTSAMEDMSAMFYACVSLTDLDISFFDTENAESMMEMFGYCKELKQLDLSSFDTSNVTNMRGMFEGCSSLVTKTQEQDGLDVSSFSTGNVADMSEMFSGCSSLLTLNLRHFDTNGTTTMDDMFNRCSALFTVYVGEGWQYPAETVTDAKVLGDCNAVINRNLDDPIDTRDTFLMDGKSFRSQIPEDTTKIVFTHEVKPEASVAVNLASDGSDKIVGWSEGTVFYVSTQNDKTIYAARDCTEMFAHGEFHDDLILWKLEEIVFDNFDTSETENMNAMFRSDYNLKKLDVTKWDTSKVTNMSVVFSGCSSLTDLDVTNWNTVNVTNMSGMFMGCSSLTDLDVTKWDTSKVTDMSGVFSGCSSLTDLDVTKWDTSKVTDMSGVFSGCSSLTGLDVTKWDTSKVTDMSEVFRGCESLTDLDMTKWDTVNVTNMSRMFGDCKKLKRLDLSSFDTSKVTDMSEMFSGCSSLVTKTQEQDGLDISNFDTTNVLNMSKMFRGCSSLLALNLRHFDTNGTTTMDDMFNGCSALFTVYVGEGWQYPAETVTDAKVLGDCNAVINRNLDDPIDIRDTFLMDGKSFRSQIPKGTSKIVFTHEVKPEAYDAINLASDGSDKVVGWSEGTVFYVSTQNDKTIYAARDCTGMFSVSGAFDDEWGLGENDLSALEEIVFDNFDTSETVKMDSMFKNASKLKKVDVSGFDTSKITKLNNIFYGCKSLTGLDVTKWDTSKVTDMSRVFCGCKSLTELDVTKWDTSKVTDMSRVFYGCSSLTELDVTKWDTSKVIDMSGMFMECGNLISLDLRNFDTQKVEEMQRMFWECSKLDFVFTGEKWKTAASASDMLYECPGQLVSCDAQSGQEPLNVSCYLRNGQEFQCVLARVQEKNDVKLTKIVFTDLKKPENADAVAVAADGKTDKLVGWLDGTVFYVSSQGNGRIYANVNSESMFNSDLGGTSTYDGEYYYSTSLLENVTEIDLSNLDTSQVKNMKRMFSSSSVRALDLSGFDTSKVTDMSKMFSYSSDLETVDLSSFVIDQKPKMDEMFSDCSGLATVYISDNESWKGVDLSSLIDSDMSAEDIFQVKTGK